MIDLLLEKLMGYFSYKVMELATAKMTIKNKAILIIF